MNDHKKAVNKSYQQMYIIIRFEYWVCMSKWMDECGNDVTCRTRNLEWACWFQKFIVGIQRSKLCFERHKNESAYVLAHHLLGMWQMFSENCARSVKFHQLCLPFLHVVVLVQTLVASARREAQIGQEALCFGKVECIFTLQ